MGEYDKIIEEWERKNKFPKYYPDKDFYEERMDAGPPPKKRPLLGVMVDLVKLLKLFTTRREK